jgi:hypothetical protein
MNAHTDPMEWVTRWPVRWTAIALLVALLIAAALIGDGGLASW